MSGCTNIIPFPQAMWSGEDLNLLNAIGDWLIQKGVAYERIDGETDRGDPWVAFMHPSMDDYVLCISKIGVKYIAERWGGRTLLGEATNLRILADAVFNSFVSNKLIGGGQKG